MIVTGLILTIAGLLAALLLRRAVARKRQAERDAEVLERMKRMQFVPKMGHSSPKKFSRPFDSDLRG